LGAGAGTDASAGEAAGVSVNTVSLRIVGGPNTASTALRATEAPAPKATPTNWKKTNLIHYKIISIWKLSKTVLTKQVVILVTKCAESAQL